MDVIFQQLTNAFIHRAVAKYLQTVFDKEDLHGRKELHLDNLLVGKTKKEASRMFFETLVWSRIILIYTYNIYCQMILLH